MGENHLPTFTIQKLLSIYGSDTTRATVISAEKAGLIPAAQRKDAGSVRVRHWDLKDVPKLGARYGFLKRFNRPMVITVFTTKGGVLKTTLALNIARMAALHDMKTCVVGLDLQGDITHTLGFDAEVEDTANMEEALALLNNARGLADLHSGEATLDDIILPTDIPTLSVIPETPELAMLEQGVAQVLRREYWLKEHVTDRLKEKFDLVVLDCSPNWNFLVTNALVACDVLVCPLECKINNFRNFRVFQAFTETFRRTLHLDFEQVFVPSRLTSTRKLSTSIRAWYMSNIRGCTNTAIRESAQGEEATAAKLSLPEYAPRSVVADEMRELLLEIWARTAAAVERPAITSSPTPTREAPVTANA
jgi:chromosome partitioning protein